MAKEPSGDPGEFEQIFEKLTDLLQFTVEHINQPITGEVPKDIEAQLERLERDVTLFCSENKALLDAAKASDTKDHLTKAERRSLERSKKLLEKGQQELEVRRQAEAAGRTASTAPAPKSDVAAKISRKKQFRNLGGNRDWKPL
jgi:hypothetical protein